MADFDVSAEGLASPPPEPYQQQYQPGILVRNNGIAGAIATGYLQMYDKATGLLLDSWTVESGTIGAGLEGTAYADENVDLSGYDPGTELLFSGLVTTDNDQVPSNNPLSPVTVTVQEGESPDPPVVAAHAAQHESGGTDQLDLSGLTGKLGTEQEPEDHAARHQFGGEDEMTVANLSGRLADAQLPDPHANNRHTETFATDADLADHETAVTAHDVATNLEKTANKGAADGYCGLDSGALVDPSDLGTGAPDADQFLRGDQVWQSVVQDTIPAKPLFLQDVGVYNRAARADHRHNTGGGVSAQFARLTQYVGPNDYLIGAGCPDGGQLPLRFTFRTWLCGRVFGSLPKQISFGIYFGPTGTPADLQIGTFVATVQPTATCERFSIRGDTLFLNDPSTNGLISAEHILQYPAASVPGCTSPVDTTISTFGQLAVYWNTAVPNSLSVYNHTPGGGPDYVMFDGGNVYLVLDELV